MRKPYEVIHIDKYTNQIDSPVLLLMTRSFKIIGKINRYDNWNISLSGNSPDEITFDVHKFADGIKCPIWDDLIDLKVVDVKGFGRFEISVDYTDNTETVKSVHGYSLEVELGQIPVYELHINDEESMDVDVSQDYDTEGKFTPTVFCNKNDVKHSLLHRVLADKAPHWSIGRVPTYVAMSDKDKPELATGFQRTYTVDGETIYDFLTGTVAEETNVIFIFDTINRIINCYSLCDCIDQETGQVLEYGIGEDTTIFVSKSKLANEISITSNKDSVKNCFRVEGGDDLITDMVRAVNVNGSNYIYQFADFQYNDMSPGLVEKLKSYQDKINSKEIQDKYYGTDGIYTRLCAAFDNLYDLESGRMPNVKIEPSTAKDEYTYLYNNFNNAFVAVNSVNKLGQNDPTVTKNVTAMAQTLVDSRYEVTVVDGTGKYNPATMKWTGRFRITRKTDKNETYPLPSTGNISDFTIDINEDELEYAKQKLEKYLAKSDMLNVDFTISDSPYTNPNGTLNETEIRKYFNQYCLNRLVSFADGYNSCVSILIDVMQKSQDKDATFYNRYLTLYNIVDSIRIARQKEVDDCRASIEKIQAEQIEFQKDLDFQEWLGEYYNEFCSYRREDSYKNDNYISDGLNDAECIAKAKELVDVASKEAKKACVLQRTVSTTLNNLFALPEFEPLYDKFALFNYIRIRTEDEILKLRLLQIDFDGTAVENIGVTFAEQIESVDGTMSDLESVIKQAGSMATSYSSTMRQAKQGSEAQDSIREMYSGGLSAAKTMLKNSDFNEVTMGGFGLLCRNMSNEGSFGDKQLRLIGNGMYLTDDAWKTVKMAVGEITVDNKPTYGIIADTIIGELIVGRELLVGNTNGTVTINGDGITIKNGTIQSANYSPEKSGSKLDLSNGTFDFGGGSLKWDGNTLTTKGDITASKLSTTGGGNLGPWQFGSNAIWRGSESFGNASTMYFGTSGLSIKDKFKVNSNGILTADGADINGKVTATELTATNSGNIGPFFFNTTSMYKGSSSWGATGEGNIYLGNSGFSLSDKLKFNSNNGSLDIKGNITTYDKIIFKHGINETIIGYDGWSQEGQLNTTFSINDALHVSGEAWFSHYIYSDGDITGQSINALKELVVNKNSSFHGNSTFDGLISCSKNITLAHSVQIKGTTDLGNTHRIAQLYKNNADVGGDPVNCIAFGDIDLRTYVVAHDRVYIHAPNGIWTRGTSGPSDRRLKTNFQNLDNRYLILFDNLCQISFNWKDDKNMNRKSLGYIAQEVIEAMHLSGINENETTIVGKAVLPDQETDGEMYSLSYDSLGIVAAYALQDARKRIAEIENKLEMLTRELKY